VSHRQLDREVLRTLGRFRQSYQMLRETIRAGKRLDWNWSEHPEYVDFKRDATAVASLLHSGKAHQSTAARLRGEAWLAVTSNEWESRGRVRASASGTTGS